MVSRQRENPIFNILFNIVIPVVILRNGSEWLDSIDVNALNIHNDSFTFLIAILFPCVYFVYDLKQKKDINFIAIIGFLNVLLTGGIGIFGGKLGLSKNWFIIKEGSLPLIIGLILWGISKYKRAIFNSVLLNDIIFDTDKIKNSLSDNKKSTLDNLSYNAGAYLIIGFFISSIIQFILASQIITSNPGEPNFNKEVSTMTWVSYVAVFLPTVLIVGRGFLKLINGIEDLTGLEKEDFLRAERKIT